MRWRVGRLILIVIGIGAASAVAAVVTIGLTTTHPDTGVGSLSPSAQQLQSESTTAPSGSFDFTTPNGYTMRVVFTGAQTPSASTCVHGSGSYAFLWNGCTNGTTDNLTVMQFQIQNVGHTIVASFTPYAVFATAAGVSGTTSVQLSGFSTATNLLPGYQVTMSSAVIEVPPGTTITSVIFVPYQSASEPFPTWTTNVSGSPSWCSQAGEPAGCSSS